MSVCTFYSDGLRPACIGLQSWVEPEAHVECSCGRAAAEGGRNRMRRPCQHCAPVGFILSFPSPAAAISEREAVVNKLLFLLRLNSSAAIQINTRSRAALKNDGGGLPQSRPSCYPPQSITPHRRTSRPRRPAPAEPRRTGRPTSRHLERRQSPHPLPPAPPIPA